MGKVDPVQVKEFAEKKTYGPSDVTNANGAKVRKTSSQTACTYPTFPEGETVDTCSDHQRKLRKEMEKSSSRNHALIKELMGLKFAHRRKAVQTAPQLVKETLKEYPALQLPSEV